MSDKLEISTFNNQLGMFYTCSNNALRFQVKARGNIRLGLGKKPALPCDVWVNFLYEHGDIWIGKSPGESRKVRKPMLLSKDEFDSFILTWKNDCIGLYTVDDSIPIVQYKNATSDMKYFTFCVVSRDVLAYWKFDVPPSLTSPEIVPLDCPKPHWVEFNKEIPQDAVIGGHENEPLYIMRAAHEGSLAAGKLVPSTKLGYVAWGHLAHEKKDFEVLCGQDCMWVKSFSDHIPASAVVSGRSEYMDLIMYVGRAEHNGHLIPGKVQPSHKACFIPFEGKEISKGEFEVLVVPDHGVRSSNNNVDYKYANINVPPQVMQISMDEYILIQLEGNYWQP